jgi:hypothetical protein
LVDLSYADRGAVELEQPPPRLPYPVGRLVAVLAEVGGQCFSACLSHQQHLVFRDKTERLRHLIALVPVEPPMPEVVQHVIGVAA